MGTACTFTNTFVPSGSLSLGKITYGATGTVGFSIQPSDAPEQQLLQRATTTAVGVEAAATGDSSRRLDLGTYTIIETSPTTPTDGEWTLDAVVCNDQPKAFAVGRVIVSAHRRRAPRALHVRRPLHPEPDDAHDADDTDNAHDAHHTDDAHHPTTPTTPTTPSAPLTPQAPGPDPTPGSDSQPNVVIDKQASQSTAVVNEVVDYEIPVRNQGRFTAQEVVVADLPAAGGQVLSGRSARAACRREGRVTVCPIGNLRPGQSTTIRLKMRVTKPGTNSNFAAAGSATPDLHLISNKAAAHVQVKHARAAKHRRKPKRKRPHHFVACPARAPRAHAAC